MHEDWIEIRKKRDGFSKFRSSFKWIVFYLRKNNYIKGIIIEIIPQIAQIPIEVCFFSKHTNKIKVVFNYKNPE